MYILIFFCLTLSLNLFAFLLFFIYSMGFFIKIEKKGVPLFVYYQLIV